MGRNIESSSWIKLFLHISWGIRIKHALNNTHAKQILCIIYTIGDRSEPLKYKELQITKPTSIYDRFFNRSRSIWSTILVCAATLLIPFLAAMADGELVQFTQEGSWRTVLFAPTITLYIWIISPFMTRAGENVIISLRPLVNLSDEEYMTQVYAAESISPRYEISALILGLILGIIVVTSR